MRTKFKILKFTTTLLFLIGHLPGYAQSINAILRHGNIWLVDSNGSKHQLTTIGRDTMPVLSPNKKYIAFVRKTNGLKDIVSNFDSSQIWLVNLISNTTNLIVQSKPDSVNTLSLLRGNFDDLQFSSDSKYLYFLSKAWPLSMAVHRVDIETRQDQFVSDGNSLYIFPTGKYAGYLLVLKHKYNDADNSFYDRNWLLTPDGTEIKEMPLDKLEKKGMKIK